MFGLGFGELCVLIIVAIVVIGPKDLPRVLRQVGQWAGKIRRMANDMRVQSGIDEVLRNEGITKEIQEIRRLAQGDILEPPRPPEPPKDEEVVIVREREYPREGPDSYGALPDGAAAYANDRAPSALAHDPLYATGEATTKSPSPATPAAPVTPAPVTPATAVAGPPEVPHT